MSHTATRTQNTQRAGREPGRREPIGVVVVWFGGENKRRTFLFGQKKPACLHNSQKLQLVSELHTHLNGAGWELSNLGR